MLLATVPIHSPTPSPTRTGTPSTDCGPAGPPCFATPTPTPRIIIEPTRIVPSTPTSTPTSMLMLTATPTPSLQPQAVPTLDSTGLLVLTCALAIAAVGLLWKK